MPPQLWLSPTLAPPPGASAARKASLEDKRSLIEGVDCFIFDCDGVIWRGDSVIEGVPETLDYLRSLVGARTVQQAGHLKHAALHQQHQPWPGAAF